MAIVISVVALWRTERARRRDMARLEVKLTTFVGLNSLGKDEWSLAFEAVNRGLQGSTVVTGFYFKPTWWARLRYDAGRAVLMPSAPVVEVTRMPANLGPAESAIFPVKVALVVGHMRQAGLEPKHYRPWAQTGHGNVRGAWAKAGFEMAAREFRDGESSSSI